MQGPTYCFVHRANATDLKQAFKVAGEDDALLQAASVSSADQGLEALRGDGFTMSGIEPCNAGEVVTDQDSNLAGRYDSKAMI